ncbi:YheC/YheD family protein [Proteinivorax hydrogeniformans]|uniref:YheC/YheD family protein n=1 Tax=Proteinivorax hydrogeniformans TaxID=1826727 RepID=A0AAU8HV13_9FIRM
MKSHKPIRDKMKRIAVLSKDPILKNHIPDTNWFSHENLKQMLDSYKTIYIKPNKGNSGNKIIRIKSVEGRYEVSFGGTRQLASMDTLKMELDIICSTRKYFIQEGIDLATFKGRPFDMRVVMQKPYNSWQLTLTSAKVATKKNAAVTNVSKGAEDFLLQKILCNYDQKKDPMATFREIVDIAHQISYSLSNKFPLRIIGLDLAIDKNNKVWFIEANTVPLCKQCKKVNDKSSQRKYVKAKKVIRESLETF